jgi:uncharacterized membrane protein YhaH (DUF805 family)
MAGHANRQPRWITIIVALAVTGIGVLGTFVDFLPEKVGIWSFVIATVVMLLGVFLPGL